MMRETNFNGTDGEIVSEENIQVYSDFMKTFKFIRQSIVGHKIKSL